MCQDSKKRNRWKHENSHITVWSQNIKASWKQNKTKKKKTKKKHNILLRAIYQICKIAVIVLVFLS